jgi:hypothetical protein
VRRARVDGAGRERVFTSYGKMSGPKAFADAETSGEIIPQWQLSNAKLFNAGQCPLVPVNVRDCQLTEHMTGHWADYARIAYTPRTIVITLRHGAREGEYTCMTS